MTRQALEDAYIAGFNDGRDSVGKVSDDDAATHCLLGFDGWWSNALDTLNRAPSSVPVTPAQSLVPTVTFQLGTYSTNPPTIAGIGAWTADRQLIGVGTVNDFKRCAADLDELEKARK